MLTRDAAYLSILNLNTNTVSNVTYANNAHPQIFPNGGTWLARTNKVYIGNAEPGEIWSIDAKTHQADLVLNSYFGLSFPLVDDLAFATQNNIGTSVCRYAAVRTDKTDSDYLFFTVVDPKGFGYEQFPTAQLPNGVWRYDTSRKVLVNVLGRNQVLVPNGVRFAPDQRTLYVTDSSTTQMFGPGIGGVNGMGPANGGGQYIWRFQLGADMFPTEQTLFAFVRSGIADGIHVDDAGRVWTAEFDGIVVRNAQGKELGVFNAQAFGAGNAPPNEIANFALAGDTLVVLAGDRLWTVKLAQVVVSPVSPAVD